MAQLTDMSVQAGDDITVEIPIKNLDGTIPDLTGASAKWKLSLKANSTGSDILIQKDTAGATMTLSLMGGVWTASIPLLHADTKSLPPKSYHHELTIIDFSGKISTVLRGACSIIGTLIASAL